MENYQISESICRKRLSLFCAYAAVLGCVGLCLAMFPCEWQRKWHFITSLWDNIKAHTVHILIGKCSGSQCQLVSLTKANTIIPFCMSSVFERWKLQTKVAPQQSSTTVEYIYEAFLEEEKKTNEHNNDKKKTAIKSTLLCRANKAKKKSFSMWTWIIIYTCEKKELSERRE